MNFEQALQAALSGRLIAREAWPASQVLRHCGDWYVGRAGTVNSRGALYRADGAPYTASRDDMLANDWLSAR